MLLSPAPHVRHLRWGPPIHRTWTGPGQYDWSFPDDALADLAGKGIDPILDLCHFGMPDWLGNTFQNLDFPAQFARYAGDLAQALPEGLPVHAHQRDLYLCARLLLPSLGWWNERLTSRSVTATAPVRHNRAGRRGGVWGGGARGRGCPSSRRRRTWPGAGILAMEAILEVNPRALFIQSESTEYYHPVSPEVEAHGEFLNLRRFLSLDLTYGRHVSAPLYQYLNDNGLGRDEYDWFDLPGPSRLPPPLSSHPSAPTITRPTSSSSTPTAKFIRSARSSAITS